MFVDANIPMYAAGRSHPFKESSAEFLRAVGTRQVDTVRPRDAIHAAVMLRTGVRTIVSYDRHFDELPGIVRVTPGEATPSEVTP